MTPLLRPHSFAALYVTLRNESAGKIVGGLNRMFALKTGFSMPRLVQHDQ